MDLTLVMLYIFGAAMRFIFYFLLFIFFGGGWGGGEFSYLFTYFGFYVNSLVLQLVSVDFHFGT